MTYLLALDQGTSSSRSIVFDAKGQQVASAQLELPQVYPQPGWVEHDPMEIWRTQLSTAREALLKAGLKASDIRAAAITNQRGLEPQDGPADSPRHRLARPPRRADLRRAARSWHGRHHSAKDGPAD